MKLFAERKVAELPISYGSELSKAARMFGASSQRDARRNPGGFGRPAIGYADYWENQASKALQRAIKSDKELKDFYETAQHLGGYVKASITEPRFMLDGPDTAAANELADVTSSIVEILDAKDLHFAIGDKWIERSVDLGSFALRVIDARALLYPGLPEDIPSNTAEFWQPVADLAPQS